MDIIAMVRPMHGDGGGGGGGGYGCVVWYSSEEEFYVLPRHTKVVVTGNNRTKSVLVGLQGVVKKAVGLGGWHWLVRTNGIEVKLQRNALSVIEPATGHEDDGIIDMDENKIDSEAIQWNNNNNNLDIVSCDHNNNNVNNDDDSQKQHHRRRKSHRTPAIHKSISKLPITTSKSSMKVDLSELEADTLSRYRRYFNLVDAIDPNPSKDQLLVAVQRHFTSQDSILLFHIVSFFLLQMHVACLFHYKKKAFFRPTKLVAKRHKLVAYRKKRPKSWSQC
ncbi:hypothetical protein ZOSMA_79G00640 [Zostera marina]|uniref:Histone deacetylase complex subunit SAP30 Sin3 binding domain-containing protein n=1 Tax=Zostera marina TaxID=29655 RepID=A0A0K9NQI3_ZOSMR|nr:hypothetical protein ZOSMA_79G00640 [Zostera marina]